jgi:thiol-disulfide isomerase/thioredoxin
MTMKSFATLAFLSLIAGTNAIELTPDNWETETAGKTVLIKFFAPSCGDCKKMKPDWDKLMDAFAGSLSVLVGDVDCTTEGNKALCDFHRVRGYPTIKYGSTIESSWGEPVPAMLDGYKGYQDYDSLKQFAESLDACSPSDIHFCDADQKAEIEKYMAMPDADLDAAIAAKEAEIETSQSSFEEEVAKLRYTHQDLMAAKEKTIEDVKNSGLGLMKAVEGADADLDAAIAAKEAELETAESSFKDEVAKLQDAHQDLWAAKEKTYVDVMNSGLRVMKAVKGGHALYSQFWK